jgi:hypothetical protein
MNEAFIAAMTDPVGREKLLIRQKARSDERITVKMARDAGWSDAEMKTACNAAWEACRTTNYLDVLKQRGTEVFYNQGSNDNVSPGLVELGRRFPNCPFSSSPVASTAARRKRASSNPSVACPRWMKTSMPSPRITSSAHAAWSLRRKSPRSGTRPRSTSR